MRSILSILLISVILFSCSNENKRKRILMDEITIKNKLFYNEDGLYSGIIFDLFENGKVEFEYNFVKGQMKGVQKVWYENGQLKCKFNIKDNLPNPLECYEYNGSPMKCNYFNLSHGINVFEKLNEQIKKDSTKLNNMEKDPVEQENVSREKYLMKKEGEDLFIIKKKEINN